MTSGKRWWVVGVLGAVAAVVVSAAPPARAEGKGQVIGVVVEGAFADQISGWIEDHVAAPDTVKDDHAFRAALRARGALPLHPAANGDARDAQLVARVRAAAKAAGIDRAILVDVHKTARATRVHVWDVDVHAGTATVDGDMTLPASAAAIDATRAVLGLEPPRRETAGTDAPAPAAAPSAGAATVGPPSQTAPPDPAPEPDQPTQSAPANVDSSLFSVGAALGVGMRHFSYSDRITQTLRPYDLAAAPVAVASGVVYPLARAGLPVLRDLGIAGEYAQAFAVSSQDSAGSRVGTTWQSFAFGLTERIALGRGVIADVSAGYGGNDFQFTQSLAGGAAALPSVAYRFARFGADLRGRILGVTVVAGGSYLDVLSSGYTAELFPRQTVGGVEGRVGASYTLLGHLDVSLTAAYTRMFFSFNPQPGDTSVAGGALDEQTRVLAGLAYAM